MSSKLCKVTHYCFLLFQYLCCTSRELLTGFNPFQGLEQAGSTTVSKGNHTASQTTK
jgi:hypothetical protein